MSVIKSSHDTNTTHTLTHTQPSTVVASIAQPTPEEMRKRQLANQLFGMSGSLTGPARAPRAKRRGGEQQQTTGRGVGAGYSPRRRSGGQNDVGSVVATATTDLLLDLQVSHLFCCCTCLDDSTVQFCDSVYSILCRMYEHG